ncbi:hypothetical protein ABMA09_18440 [Erwinia rhapontici]|uniref:hypothetical protein n=1 Tax=Erwinia rhapontici TaxID=55212 RepID=UPI00133184E8|nr:hypothetical protein [Erwinia rhapontici]MBP2157170.1 hypothetical protein [Erwinia rhapontici]
MIFLTKTKHYASLLEDYLILFLIKRAGKWTSIINKQVEAEVMEHFLEMAAKCESAGHEWHYDKMSPLIDDMRRFRSESIKFAFGHVLSAAAILFSLIAIVISIVK